METDDDGVFVRRQGNSRPLSLAGALRAAGFLEVAKAERLIQDRALRQLVGTHAGRDESEVSDVVLRLVDRAALTADPDRALLALVRLAQAAVENDSEQPLADLRRILELNAEQGAGRSATRLFAVLGASAALGDELVRHPELVATLASDAARMDVLAAVVRAELLCAVGADPGAQVPVAQAATDDVVSALRIAYRSHLLRIAACDLTAPDPRAGVEDVARALADLAAAALEAALAIARAGEADADQVRFTVIGLGKCGGRELNYVSDVDVIYIVEPAENRAPHDGGSDHEDAVITIGTRLATAVARICSSVGDEPALWPVDTGLRPEGADGPLVRTLASHVAYYRRWASTWEFQALLRARPVAGDRGLGQDYLEQLSPLVWKASARENFVADSQAMRRRVEEHIPQAHADRQLKLGRGGLRDIEFTVQLLQLVHGRTDPAIRSPHTLTALDSLSAGGYVGRADASRMAGHYRFLRLVEHRIQLDRLRRNHVLPTAESELRRLGRSIGLKADVVPELVAQVRRTQHEVRDLHEALFYRPLLTAVTRLSAAQVAMTPEAVRERLTAIGYRDPSGATRHIRALTESVSRTAAIQRQLLPAMLGWFARGADPDAGLLGFRTLSEELGRTPWFLKLLRDSPTAAPRLARALASSPYLTQALMRSPESIRWFADDDALAPLGRERLRSEVGAIVTRSERPETAIQTVRAIRRRELARTAAAELLHLADPLGTAQAIAGVTDVVIEAALTLAEQMACGDLGLTVPAARMLVVGMGSMGGGEPGYGSDADVLFVHEPLADNAQTYAVAVATTMRSLLQQVGPEPPLGIDADLRPEGRSGPLVRSLDAYREYYARWGEVWERQALLRARPIAGDGGLAERFIELINPVRYPETFASAQVREIRRIKARVERERLPRAVHPVRHLKLGPGSQGDVEWTVQLLQLGHAHEFSDLRTTSTLDALAALVRTELLAPDDADALRTAWLLGASIRNALTLWTGRTTGSGLDVLPADQRKLYGLGTILGYAHDAEPDLEEDYLRAARRARRVVDRVFYDKTPEL